MPTTTKLLSAMLFGYGNDAKTQIIRNIERHLDLVAIHEVDPDQLRGVEGTVSMLDTSPRPRGDEAYDNKL